MDKYLVCNTTCICYPTGMTHANELASKHAKARAPNTQHDSSTEWQRQGVDAKGDIEEWEGDLLILGVGNAQQAGGLMLIRACPF